MPNLWDNINVGGRPPAYQTPELLWGKCQEYFQWAKDNPLNEAGVTQGKLSGAAIPKMRAMTKGGLCLFLGITQETWNQYKNKPRFSVIKEHVDAIIYEQKFTGAAAGLLAHQIIARELGLVDKQSIDIKDVSARSRDELLAELAELERRVIADDTSNVKLIPANTGSQTENIS